MDISEINKILYENIDAKYRIFSAKLLPQDTKVLGIRLPFLRKLAKQILKDDWQFFLQHFEPDYLEERLLYGFVIAYAPLSFSDRLRLVKKFVPLINNWSVCDSFCASFKLNNNDKILLWQFVQPYMIAKGEYERRFAIVMCLNYLIDDKFVDEIIDKLRIVNFDEYYVQMALAWALAEIYISYPEKIEELLYNKILSIEVHNKTIQKIRESLRVDKNKKDNLLKLRRIK